MNLRFGKELADDPSLNLFEKAYIKIFGAPVQGLRVRSRYVLPEIPQYAKRIFDNGCGRGAFLLHLAKKMPDTLIAAVDLDFERLKKISAIAKKLQLKNILLVNADLFHPPFRDSSFDTLISIDVIEDFDNDLDALNAIKRTMTDGARLVLHTPHIERFWFLNWGPNFEAPGHARIGYSKDELSSLLSKTGLIHSIKFTYNKIETIANNISYLITGAKEKNKIVYATVFPFLYLLTIIGNCLPPPKKGAGLLAIAEKQTSLPDNISNRILNTLRSYCKSQDWTGYDKHDALLSPVVKTLTANIRLLEIAAAQVVVRAPVNLRPLLGVKTFRNPKGMGLFIRALLDAEDLDKEFRNDAILLGNWLLENRARIDDSAAWGYQFPWPSLHFPAKAGEPNAIVTTFAAEGLLDLYNNTRDKKYLDGAEKTAVWLFSLPRLIDENDRVCPGYSPKAKNRIININSVIAGFLSRLYTATEKKEYIQFAEKLLRYVASVQTKEGAWYYTDPASADFIEHDNYHTGGILDGFMDYLEVKPDKEMQEVFRKGLEFYYNNLFEDDGFPRWERRKKYPADIHGAAQGIITFSRARKFDAKYGMLADKILHWTLQNLYDPSGFFYYQKTRFGTKRWTLMRWCNAWMMRAIAVYRKTVYT